MGRHYECRVSSQNEFVHHFGIPPSDPRHPDQGANQQLGIYSAYMFSKPNDTSADGIHLINIDARFHRSPTYDNFGPCEGSSSTMLGDTQWEWLQNELLTKQSEIKIIGSGIQVLPPTHKGRPLEDYCSYDGSGETFDQAMIALNEASSDNSGTLYESWGEMPQERTRLLQLCQESINSGMTKQVIFMSGDQHWAEIMAKEVPARSNQPAVTVYEVTASGIDQNWNAIIPNPNRVRLPFADTRGEDANFRNECHFPFVHHGITFKDCATNTNTPNGNDPGINGWCRWGSGNDDWGICESKSQNKVPNFISMEASREHVCDGNALHVCTAKANYGGIEVDWNSNQVSMAIYTPHETEAIAGRIVIPL